MNFEQSTTNVYVCIRKYIYDVCIFVYIFIHGITFSKMYIIIRRVIIMSGDAW